MEGNGGGSGPSPDGGGGGIGRSKRLITGISNKLPSAVFPNSPPSGS
jgi:hypothetical protein